MGKRAALLALIALLTAAVGAADAQVRRAKGWIREPPQVKATLPLMLRFRDYLPEEVDLSSRFPTPGDQGQQSSCTAWATAYAARSYYEAQRSKWTYTSAGQLISPAYVYNRVNNFSGRCDVGSAISEALQVLKNEGAPTLSAYPYIEDNCARPPTPDLLRIGSQFRISGFTGVDNKRLDDIKGQLAQGNPVIFGMEVSDAFDNWSGNTVYDDVSSPRTGGHAMVIVGYSERKQAFRVINSWGTEWGDRGLAWISYRAIRQLSDVMFVMDVPPPALEPPKPVVIAPPQPQPVPRPIVVEPPEPSPEPKPVVVAPPEPSPAPKPDVVSPPEPTPPEPAVVVPQPPVPAPPVVITPPAPAPKPVVVTPPGPAPKPVVVRPPAPQPKPVVPPVRTLQAEAIQRLNAVKCSRLTGSVGNDRVVHVRGFAGSAQDLAKAEEDMRAMPGVRAVDSAAVAIYRWPQCEVFLDFADALKTPRGLSIALPQASTRVLREGDSLLVQVTTPSFPSYLYVTYLQANGDAVHLAWPEGRVPKAVLPNTRITFGGGGAQPTYRITAPVGDEIIVVVASASPLFQDELPETSIDREYLTSFRKAFLTAPRSGGGSRIVSAVAMPIRTEASR